MDGGILTLVAVALPTCRRLLNVNSFSCRPQATAISAGSVVAEMYSMVLGRYKFHTSVCTVSCYYVISPLWSFFGIFQETKEARVSQDKVRPGRRDWRLLATVADKVARSFIEE